MKEKDRYNIPLAQIDTSIGKPFDTSLPHNKPELPHLEMMAFNSRVRKYWMEVGKNKCQFEFYDDKYGWKECREKAKHVHHIIGESDTLARGDDPHENIGLPLCEFHHVRNLNEEEHSYDFAFHPDMGKAYDNYREWKQREEHMNSITGRRRIRYENSPFAHAHRGHLEKIARGERYMAGTPEIDEYYRDKMLSKATMYNAEKGIKKPQHKPHKNYDPKKKTHWSDRFFK